MKTKLLALAFLAGGSMFAQTRFSIGIHFGGSGSGYYSAPPVYAVQPPCPGPDYSWSEGYWDQGSGRRAWMNGYWARQSRFRGEEWREHHDRDRRERDRDRRYDRDDYRGNDHQGGYRNR